MSESAHNLPVILVTGGTSGLGLEIVKQFLRRDFFVIATGRRSILLEGYEERFRFYRVDFNDLKDTADVVRTICNNHQVSVIVNNAGILSPPDFRTTKDDFEYTFQVNFYAHLLVNELIIRRFGNMYPLRIAAITSVVYKLAKPDMNYCRHERDYSSLKAYSDSKLFLVMMCRHLASRYRNIDLKCFSFDPGVFGSSIFRMQKGWFRLLYRIAAPFMRSPESVAKVLAEILTENDFNNGEIYNIRKRIKTLKEINPDAVALFWEECYSILGRYLY
jgi:NAD(P)-dependent dehydrogenase (short-subunit alcohol dehydrogenase family)